MTFSGVIKQKSTENSLSRAAVYVVESVADTLGRNTVLVPHYSRYDANIEVHDSSFTLKLPSKMNYKILVV